MTQQRRRMRPLVVLMSAAMALVYVSAGVDVDGGSELVAAGDVPPALTVANQIAPQAQAVPDSETSGTVPSEVDPQNVAAVGIDPAIEKGGEAEASGDLYPVRIRIPAISVDAAVVDLGLNQDGTLEVPTDFGVTGWYTGRSVPGDSGPSVVVGHVDSHTGPAVFFEMSRLEVGDLIQIDRSDGFMAWFQIRELTLVDKDEFPTQQVYGDTAEPTLRLVTCGGDFDSSARSYRENLIAFADHLGNSATAISTEKASLAGNEAFLSGSSPG